MDYGAHGPRLAIAPTRVPRGSSWVHSPPESGGNDLPSVGHTSYGTADLGCWLPVGHAPNMALGGRDSAPMIEPTDRGARRPRFWINDRADRPRHLAIATPRKIESTGHGAWRSTRGREHWCVRRGWWRSGGGGAAGAAEASRPATALGGAPRPRALVRQARAAEAGRRRRRQRGRERWCVRRGRRRRGGGGGRRRRGARRRGPWPSRWRGRRACGRARPCGRRR